MEIHQAVRALRQRETERDRERDRERESPWCLVGDNVTAPVDALPPFSEAMDQHAAETRLRLFEELPTAGLGWDDDDMEALNDLDDLPGMPMHRQTPPDSPAKRLKRGFEQLELAETPTRNAAAVVVAHAAGEPLAPGFLDSRRTLSDTFVRRVAIVGGTHGNERNGVALAQHFIDCPQHIARPSFECTAMIGNPAAVQANQR